ncbi:MAG: AMP-binding protein [Bacteriovoracaceae bacterium]|nr:AMP-binding protein [Bacteriovoracaceae bacterium]
MGEVNLIDILSSHKTSVAYTTFNKTITYEQLTQKVLQTCSYLIDNFKISENDRIALVLHDKENFLITLLSLWHLKASVVPLSPYTPTLAIEDYKNHAPFLKLLTDYTLPCDSYPVSTLRHNIDDSCESLIIFTSGSSGDPKGVRLSLNNLISSAQGTIDFYQLSSNDSWALSLPLNHIGGIMIIVRSILIGGQVIIDDSKDSSLEHLINGLHPTCLSVVPTMLIRLIKNPQTVEQLKKMKAILLGGAPAPSWLVEFCYREQIPVCLTYGLSEMASQVTSTYPIPKYDDLTEVVNTSGAVLPNRLLKIDSNGRILTSGPTLFLGYITGGKNTFPFLKDGLFQTSDIGALTSKGTLEILGRGDLQFMCGGENISPIEIEQAISSLTYIEESTVVPVNDPEFGEVPFVFLKATSAFNLQHFSEDIKKLLPPYKIPKYFYHQEIDPNINFFDKIKTDRQAQSKQAYKIVRENESKRLFKLL